MLKYLLSFMLCGFLSAKEGITDPTDYRKNSSLQWKWAMESLEAFPLEENDCVLDLGCRNGAVTEEIASKAGIVIALDISEEMLADARAHHSVPNIIYIQGDARKLPFTEQFDKVIALLSLNWVNEQDQALQSLYTALKPGGKAIITRPGKQPSNLGPVSDVLVKTDRWAPYFPNYASKRIYYTAEEYTALLENAGFTIEKISQDSTYTYFKDREALTGFFRPICNFIDHLSPDLKKQFVKEVVDRVLEYDPPKSDGSIHLHDFKLEAIVSK